MEEIKIVKDQVFRISEREEEPRWVLERKVNGTGIWMVFGHFHTYQYVQYFLRNL